MTGDATMAIVFQCANCNHTLRVREDVAGKRIKCPQCQEVLRIPESSPHEPAGVSPSGNEQAAEAEPLLQLKTPDGSIYGPVPRSEMDRWLAEGRITAQCELLDKDGHHWRWAGEVYPQLAAAATPPPPPPGDAIPRAPVTVAPVVPAAPSPAPTTPAWPSAEAGAPAHRPKSWSEAAPPSFRPRAYPAMNLTSKFYRLLGWLLIFVAGIGAFFFAVIFVGGSIVSSEMGTAELAVYLGLSLLGLMGGAVYVAAMVITLWFASEAIKCLLDIEDNSHRCSFYLQNLNRRENVE